MLRWRKRRLPITGGNFLQTYAFHVAPSTDAWAHCLSREVTESAKLALEKQISQPSLVMALCMSSVQASVAISWANKMEYSYVGLV